MSGESVYALPLLTFAHLGCLVIGLGWFASNFSNITYWCSVLDCKTVIKYPIAACTCKPYMMENPVRGIDSKHEQVKAMSVLTKH